MPILEPVFLEPLLALLALLPAKLDTLDHLLRPVALLVLGLSLVLAQLFLLHLQHQLAVEPLLSPMPIPEPVCRELPLVRLAFLPAKPATLGRFPRLVALLVLGLSLVLALPFLLPPLLLLLLLPLLPVMELVTDKINLMVGGSLLLLLLAP